MSSKVLIYSTSSCPYCKMAKQFFDEHNIEYQDIDVSDNHDATHEMIEKSGQLGVPVIIIKNDEKEEIVIGFDQTKIKKILNIK